MNLHQNFLQFNGTNIIFVKNNGEYWIALRPILEALKIDADSSIKRTRKDPFFGGCTANIAVQVGKKGENQARKMICLPEKYIYGWITTLNSKNKELIEYKRTCYDILHKHFHGTITNRREILMERRSIDNQIGEIKQALKEQDEAYKQLEKLIKKRKNLNQLLNTFDKELIQQPTLF